MQNHKRTLLITVGCAALIFAVVRFARFGFYGSDEKGYPGITYCVFGLAIGIACLHQAMRKRG